VATEWAGESVGEAYRYDSLAAFDGVGMVYCETVRSSSDMTRKEAP